MEVLSQKNHGNLVMKIKKKKKKVAKSFTFHSGE